METPVIAPQDGEVVGIYVTPGDAVSAGQVLFAIRTPAEVAA